MVSRASSRAVRVLLRIARRIGLTELVRAALPHLPKGAEPRVRALRARLRAASEEMESFVSELGTLVPEAELERCYDDALRLLSERLGRAAVGDYLEFGVYTGTSLAAMHRALVKEGLNHVRLFGFDSFEGLPQSATSDETSRYLPWTAGDYSSPIGLTKEVLRSRGVDLDRVTLVKGWFDDTLTDACIEEHRIAKASVIMIDSDLYSSAKTALEFCAPLIHDEAVILFDEWFPATLGVNNVGEQRAFNEFLAADPGLSATELESYAPGEAKVFLVSRGERRDAVGAELPSARSLEHG